MKRSFRAQVSCLTEAYKAISGALGHISLGLQLLVPESVLSVPCVSVSASQTAFNAHALTTESSSFCHKGLCFMLS